MEILENVPLSELTTFRTGGSARFLVTVYKKEDLIEVLTFAKNKKLPIIPIGSGSNILAGANGVSAVFVRIALCNITSSTNGNEVLLFAEAGVLWDDLVLHAVSEGWWGLENLSSIPGTVGAAVVQNIGAYGAAISETVVTVDVFDTKTGSERTLSREECQFGYRTSIFKKELDRYVVLGVRYALSKNAVPNLSYRDLKNKFSSAVSTPSLQEVRDAVIEIRKGKFPSLTEFGTAGSFFLNPILTDNATRALRAHYPDMPVFPLPEGGVKVPLAWIFDHVLSLKGVRIGKAFVWEKQPLVLAVEFGASTDDVVALAKHIAREVFEKTGVAIIPEVRILDSGIER